jgi:hypothetical protein
VFRSFQFFFLASLPKHKILLDRFLNAMWPVCLQKLKNPCLSLVSGQKQTNSMALSPQANYTD